MATVTRKFRDDFDLWAADRIARGEFTEPDMAEFKDTTPALFWAAKHLQDAGTRQQQAMAQLPGLVDQLQRLMAEAGAR